MFLWACGPGFFRPPSVVLFGPAARAFFALRALFSLGLRPELFFPPGILPPAGNFLLAQKVPQKRLPPVALRGFWPHSQPSWGFPQLRPSARVAGRCAKLGACQQCHLKPPRKICLARNPPGAFETASKNTLHLQPSWSFPQLRPSARVAGRCAKYGTCQQCSLHSTSCLRHEAFKRLYASFALSHANLRVNKKQCRVGTPTTLCSRLLKAGGWPQKLLLTRSEFCTVSRDPR